MLVAMELESILRGQGCTVLGPVATVDRALALIGDGQLDAALLDLNLGGRSTLPVAAALTGSLVPMAMLSDAHEPAQYSVCAG